MKLKEKEEKSTTFFPKETKEEILVRIMSGLLDFEFFCIQNENSYDINKVLMDIKNYSVSVLTQFNKDDFKLLGKAGFEFANEKKKLGDKRLELRKFLEEHPCCMSKTKDKIIAKLIAYMEVDETALESTEEDEKEDKKEEKEKEEVKKEEEKEKEERKRKEK